MSETLMPSISNAFEMSSCAAKTPMEPTWPEMIAERHPEDCPIHGNKISPSRLDWLHNIQRELQNNAVNQDGFWHVIEEILREFLPSRLRTLRSLINNPRPNARFENRRRTQPRHGNREHRSLRGGRGDVGCREKHCSHRPCHRSH